METCAYCGTNEKLIDHHTSYFPEIIVKSCRSCHTKQHNKQDKITEKEFRLSLVSSNHRRAIREREISNKPLVIDDDLRQQVNTLLL